MRGERFPGIDWECDKCGAILNYQQGFDDHKYIWKCTNCGHKNSISRANIVSKSSGPARVKFFFEMAIAYIEEVAYIGFLGAVITRMLILLQGVNFNSFFALAANSSALRVYSYKFMGYCIIGYPIMLIISFLCQKFLYFYRGIYIHKSFGSIVRSNIAIDAAFFFSFFGPTWRKGSRNLALHLILKGACFIFVWLIPTLLVIYGMFPFIKPYINGLINM